MFQNIVNYHVHQQEPLPPSSALAYQYVFAARGLYLRAENHFFDVLLPISRCHIRGLVPLRSHFRLKAPRVPARLLIAVLSDARRARCHKGGLKEVLYHFHHNGNRVRVLKPPQRTTASSIVAGEGNTTGVILDLHSHGNMGAFWSETDNEDEQGFRIYGVIGRLETKPEIRLRLGVYGYWFPIPVSLLFDELGPFADLTRQEVSRGAAHANA